MKPFCNVPFVGLSARHDGTAKICCNINKSEGITKTGTYDNPGSEKFNLNIDNFQDIWNSEYMKDFRNKMLTGGFDTACSRCITHNNQGVFTMRKKYNSHFDPIEIEKRVEETEKQGYKSFIVSCALFESKESHLSPRCCISWGPFAQG